MKHPKSIIFTLIIFAITFFLLFPQLQELAKLSKTEEPPCVNQTHFKIGVLIDYTENLPKTEYLVDYVETEINLHSNQSNSPYTFEFEVKSAEGMAATALDQVAEWKKNDVNLVAGPPWSSMFCACKGYATNNDMLVFSQGSTSPLLTVDDNGFRLTIHDFKEAQILVKLLNEAKIDSVVIIQRGDSWGDGLYDEIARKYEGEIIQIRYLAEVTEFSDYLSQVQQELEMIDIEDKAIVALSFWELGQIVNASQSFPTLSEANWYMMGASVNETRFNNVSSIMAKLNMTGITPIIPDNNQYDEFRLEYQEFANEPLGFYEANIYDICWLYALSVLETGTDNATKVKGVLLEIASEYVGITGNCSLDHYGDRNTAAYRIYRYVEDESGAYAKKLHDVFPVFDEVPQREGVH